MDGGEGPLIQIDIERAGHPARIHEPLIHICIELGGRQRHTLPEPIRKALALVRPVLHGPDIVSKEPAGVQELDIVVGEKSELLAMLFDVKDGEATGRLLLGKLRRLLLSDPVGHRARTSDETISS